MSQRSMLPTQQLLHLPSSTASSSSSSLASQSLGAQGGPQSLSRASSSNSLHGGSNDDDDDDDSDKEMAVATGGAGGGASASAAAASGSRSAAGLTYKERRREAHTQAEQKRRDAIKKGYDYLQDLVPMGKEEQQQQQAEAAGHKFSKAAVLQKSIDYIQYVQMQKKKQEEELSMLHKEVKALEIMRANYEQLVKAHQAQPADPQNAFVPSEIKFQTFQLLMDSLFQSFNEQVRMGNFTELSGCVFSWLEEQCKPQVLQELMYNVLQQVKHNYQVDLAQRSANGHN